MASFALESCSRLHIRLHNIILSYGLGQDEEDPSPLTVITIKTARTLAWKNKRILKKLAVNVKPSLCESAPLVSKVWLYTATEVNEEGYDYSSEYFHAYSFVQSTYSRFALIVTRLSTSLLYREICSFKFCLLIVGQSNKFTQGKIKAIALDLNEVPASYWQ